MANYDILGNIVILKTEGLKRKQAQTTAKELLKKPGITTVVEKVERLKGRLRVPKLKHVLGEKTFVATYKESGCVFVLDVRTCYFSPRLSNERLEIAKKIKKIGKKSKVLVMFSGVGPFPIVISKFADLDNKIVAIELGKECNKYAKENLKKNKILNDIELIQGDVKRIIPGLKKKNQKFDIIVMPRPNLKDSFLSCALDVSKKGTIIYYYGFCHEDELKTMKQGLIQEAKDCGKKIKILKVKQAGDIAPFKFRYRIEIKVLN